MSSTTKAFHGPRAERFTRFPPLDAKVGPGSYNVDEATTLSKMVTSKPSSKLGVCVHTAKRFPELKEKAPSPDKYEQATFIDLLGNHISSIRGSLNTLEQKRLLDIIQDRMGNVPGPGTYDVNTAVGRHVANDFRFQLQKSIAQKTRDASNKAQLQELQTLLNTNDLFTDKSFFDSSTSCSPSLPTTE